MNNLAPTIVGLINKHARRRRLTVGVICNGRRAVADQIIASGHRVIVIGDKFHPLLRIHTKMKQQEGDAANSRVAILEAKLDNLPIGLGTLDVLVLSNGLPPRPAPKKWLVRIRSLLKPDGLLIWPQPIQQGARSLLARMVPARRGPLGLAKREVLCRLTMEAGFNEVGQKLILKATPPLAVTTGRRKGTGDFLGSDRP